MNTIDALVDDELWNVVGPLLPPEPLKPKGGRPCVPPRAVFSGVVYVLKTGIPWGLLPKELGCSGATCWRRLRDWRKAGVFERLHRVLIDRLGKADRIDWSRVSLDSASIPAKRGGEKIGPNPLDRGRAGSKRHVVTSSLMRTAYISPRS